LTLPTTISGFQVDEAQNGGSPHAEPARLPRYHCRVPGRRRLVGEGLAWRASLGGLLLQAGDTYDPWAMVVV